MNPKLKNALKESYILISSKCPVVMRIIELAYYYLINLITRDHVYYARIKHGKEILDEITADDEYVYYLNELRLGDLIIVAGYAYYLPRSEKKVAFVVPKYAITAIKQYEYIEKVIGLDASDYSDVALYIRRSGLYETDRYRFLSFRMKVAKNGQMIYSTAKWNRNNSLSEKYRQSVFGFGPEVQIKTLPQYEENSQEAIRISNMYDIQNDSVLIAPYAVTEVKLPDSFWSNLVWELKTCGYEIYTNIGNPEKEKCIPGTKELRIPLDELYKISRRFKRIITLRSGICELLASNNAELIVINNNPDNYDKWDDVNIFSSNKTVVNVYREGRTDKGLLKEIMEIVKE